MRMYVEDAIIVQEGFATHRDLVDSYRDHESSQGRVPPAFDWPQLLIALAVFIAEYLGEKALDKLWERVRRKENVQGEASKILADFVREGGSVRIVLETKAEVEIMEQLREQLPGVEVVAASE